MKKLASGDAESVLDALVKGAAADHHGQANLQGDEQDVGVERRVGRHALQQIWAHG